MNFVKTQQSISLFSEALRDANGWILTKDTSLLTRKGGIDHQNGIKIFWTPALEWRTADLFWLNAPQIFPLLHKDGTMTLAESCCSQMKIGKIKHVYEAHFNIDFFKRILHHNFSLDGRERLAFLSKAISGKLHEMYPRMNGSWHIDQKEQSLIFNHVHHGLDLDEEMSEMTHETGLGRYLLQSSDKMLHIENADYFEGKIHQNAHSLIENADALQQWRNQRYQNAEENGNHLEINLKNQ